MNPEKRAIVNGLIAQRAEAEFAEMVEATGGVHIPDLTKLSHVADAIDLLRVRIPLQTKVDFMNGRVTFGDAAIDMHRSAANDIAHGLTHDEWVAAVNEACIVTR